MLTHQEEDADDEEWNPAKAAGVCLMNLASCCEGMKYLLIIILI